LLEVRSLRFDVMAIEDCAKFKVTFMQRPRNVRKGRTVGCRLWTVDYSVSFSSVFCNTLYGERCKAYYNFGITI
jgi:hypothetical protein